MNALLALAFAAGMLAPVNPCGFVLLPAWITYALGDQDTSPLPVRLTRALGAGAALTFGFAGTLAAAGLAISAGARALITAAPWLGLAAGIALLLLGVALLTGRSPRLHLPATTPRRAASPAGPGRLALFGVGYAAASLSCTVGVLLAVIAQAQATASYGGLLIVFAAYTGGAAAVLLLVSLTASAAGAALTRHLTALARHAPRATAGVVLLTGAYLVWYWYPAATSHTATATATTRLARWSATTATWIQAHTVTVAILAMATVLAVAAAAGRHRLRSRTTAQHPPPTAAADSNAPDCCHTEPHTATTADLTAAQDRPPHQHELDCSPRSWPAVVASTAAERKERADATGNPHR